MTPVVITGLGVVSAMGEGRESFEQGLRAGVSPIATLEGEEWMGGRPRLAARAADFDPARYVPERWRGRVGRHGAFALACARLALRDAGLADEDVAGEDTSVVLSCALGGTVEAMEKTTPLTLARASPSTPTTWVSLALGTRGPGMVLGSASSAGAQAITLAALLVASGRTRRALAGGVESPLAPHVLHALDVAGVLSRRHAEPARALRPFDRDRDGTVVGEGGAVLLLEREEDALRRGARVLARIAGTGDAMEAHHPYSLSPDGRAAKAALARALADARIDGRDVELVVTHGTGTRQNDAYEARVILETIGHGAMITATKPLTGHLLGASGAMDAAAAVTALAGGFVPAIVNCDDPDVGGLDLVRGAAREARLGHAAVLSHGLGGFSSALVLRRA